jgi:hypothetical protein
MDVRFVKTTIGHQAVAGASRPRPGAASAGMPSVVTCTAWPAAAAASTTHIQATGMFDVPNHTTRRLWELSP